MADPYSQPSGAKKIVAILVAVGIIGIAIAGLFELSQSDFSRPTEPPLNESGPGFPSHVPATRPASRPDRSAGVQSLPEHGSQ